MREAFRCLLLFIQCLAKGFTVVCVRLGQPVRKLLRDEMVDGVRRDGFGRLHVMISMAENHKSITLEPRLGGKYGCARLPEVRSGPITVAQMREPAGHAAWVCACRTRRR